MNDKHENNDNTVELLRAVGLLFAVVFLFIILVFLLVSGKPIAALILLLPLIVAIVFLVRAFRRLSEKSEAFSTAPTGAAQREFAEPEAHCVVCENTGEDHFENDRKQRLAQLDEWLKSGVIDRDEYRELKAKYQK